MKRFAFLLLLLLPFCTMAQRNNDSQLAYTYYQNKEYEKASQLFMQLYERTKSSNYLDYHIICLINGKMYDQAEEVLKKYLKTDGKNKDFLVNLGFIYEQQGKPKKSEEYYEKAVKNLIPQSSDINSLAYKFRNIREYGWAVRTYLRGQELLNKPTAFLRELGDNYLMERDYEKMMDLFIRHLEAQPGDLNTITSQLNFARSYDIINSVDTVIERKLGAVVRQTDHHPVFDELSIWYNLQVRRYDKALEDAAELNRKAKGKLGSYIQIARSASTDGKYDLAVLAYNRVLEQGKDSNDFYLTARKEILSNENTRFREQQAPQESFRKLAQQCKEYMQEYLYTPDNLEVAILLSDLYAYQLQQPDSADAVLQKSIQMRRLNLNRQSLLKFKRADLLAFMDNPWEATILYTQIEKSNPNNDIGYEAKLKKAWLAYYTGDLLWAKAQFDVLKGATSKLISNDAIQMAHFIRMNYTEEEGNHDLERLARAEYLMVKQENDRALGTLDSLANSEQPGIIDRAALQKAKLLHGLKRTEEAARILEQLKGQSEQTYIRAEAIMQLAVLKTEQQDTAGARELYKLLVSEYSGSVYSVEAGRLYRELEKK